MRSGDLVHAHGFVVSDQYVRVHAPVLVDVLFLAHAPVPVLVPVHALSLVHVLFHDGGHVRDRDPAVHVALMSMTYYDESLIVAVYHDAIQSWVYVLTWAFRHLEPVSREKRNRGLRLAHGRHGRYHHLYDCRVSSCWRRSGQML